MINKNELYLANADLLDDVSEDMYSNDGEKKFPTAEVVGAGATLAAGLIATIASKPKDPYKQEMKGVCGRKPFLASKRKKEAYQKCVSSYLQNKAILEAQARAAEARAAAEERNVPTGSGKFLGMPMAAGITLSVLVLAGVGFGIYKLIKR